MQRPAPAPQAERLPLRKPRITHCANCDIPVLAHPVEREGYMYCCKGCAFGGPCVC